MSLSFSLSAEQVERVLRGFETMERGINEIRAVFSESSTTKPPLIQVESQPQQSYTGLLGSLPIPNIDSIRWKLKGKVDAQVSDVWAFCFAKNQNGSTPPENQPVLEYLNTHGKFTVNGFEISLSKDGKFLNRKKV